MSPDRAGWLLLGVCACALLAGPRPGDAVWLAAGALPWALAVASPPELPWRPALAVWAAWLAWTGAAAIASPEPWLSIGDWWRVASAISIVGFAAAWWSRGQRRAWALGLLAAGAAAAASREAARRGAGWLAPFAAPAGAWAAAGAAGAAGWLCGERGEGFRPWAWAALAVAGTAAAFGGPWPARLAAAAAALLCAAAGPRRLGASALLVLLAAGAFAARSSWTAWHPAPAWAAALELLSDNPAAGVGPGRLARALAAQGEAAVGSHSFVLRAGAEAGVFGLALLLAAAAASIPRGFRRLDAPARAGAAAFVAFFAWLAIEDGAVGPALLLGLAAAAAITLSAGRLGEGRAADQGAPVRLHRWFTALGLAACVVAWLPRELLRRSWAHASGPVPGPAAIAALERAGSIAPRDAAAHAELARRYLLSDPPRVGEALLEARAAREADPADPAHAARLAELWAAFGDLSRAGAAAQAALELEPRFVSPRLILAEREAREGHPARARALLEEARRARERLAGAAADPALSAWDGGRERRILELIRNHGAPAR